MQEKQLMTILPVLRGATFDGQKGRITAYEDDPSKVSFLVKPENRDKVYAGLTYSGKTEMCGCEPLYIPSMDDMYDEEKLIDEIVSRVDQYRQRNGCNPRVVIIENQAAVALGTSYEESRTIMRSITSTTLKPLPGAEEREEREYTRNDVVKNKVSVVTGGAQGFGRALAEDLASSGSIVFIADLNYEGAEQVASELNDQVGSKQVFPVEVNVADEQSVENMIAEVVRTAGGIDLFISNAGVLKAGSVKALTAKNFRFVTEVNYIGYFLCVKHASPVMALQARACEEYFTDIIQINSKSGLKGSNKNSAYAGSKFGGIGLTQSFALELIEDHIKVNSICPGNFFEGPLWSDPETGLFVQYLNAGKVPGAKTIEDVKSFYESKVPFGRGCYGSDIIKAVYYLIEQKYETGQAVPVTGGQIMIR